MVSRNIRLLHVEDSRLEQRVISNYLGRMPGIEFDITCARSEDEAIAAFHNSPRDFVILDYQLSQGNGLSCLRRLRQEDSAIPIIAVSGQATGDVAAQLLHAGADDYLSKCDLDGETLLRSVGQALARADAWRRQGRGNQAASASPQAESTESGAKEAARRLCEVFISAIGAGFFSSMEECEQALRKAHLTAQELPTLFAGVYAEMTSDQPDEVSDVYSLFRPILLEMQARLADPARPLKS